MVEFVYKLTAGTAWEKGWTWEGIVGKIVMGFDSPPSGHSPTGEAVYGESGLRKYIPSLRDRLVLLHAGSRIK